MPAFRASAAGESRGELAPLVSARPLRPTTLQRSTESAPVDVSPAEPLADVTATQGDEIDLPSPRGVSQIAPTRSLFSPDLTRLAAQQRYGPILPSQGLAVGPRLQREAHSEPSLNRAAELPLAPVQRAAAEAAPEPWQAAGESTSEVVQREGFDSISSPIATAPPSSAGATADDSPGVPGPASGPMAPATKTMPQESDMDELANKLYDRIRIRLKTELLVARERAGMLTDWR